MITCIDCGKEKLTSTGVRCKRCNGLKINPPGKLSGVALLLPDLAKTMTLQQMGDRYGVSRERIRQLLARQGISRKNMKKKSKCSTPLCPKMIYVTTKIGSDKCVNCRQYAKSTAIHQRRRYFEPKIMCKNHPDRRAANVKKELCNSCRLQEYFKTDKAKAYHRAYHQKPEVRERQKKAMKKWNKKKKLALRRFSMDSASNQDWGFKYTSKWLKNYYGGVS